MKIAFFTDSYYPDISGLSISLENFINSLRRQGHEVYLFAPHVQGYTDEDKKIFRIRALKVLDSEPAVRFPILIPNATFQKMFSLNFDIVHAHGNGPFSLLGYQIARLKGVPFVLTFHTVHTKYTHYLFNGRIIKPKAVAAGLRLFANLCDGVVAPSQKMKVELKKTGFKGEVEVIPSFIDLSMYKDLEKGFLHKKLNLPASTPILLSVGRLGKEKNFPFLLHVFQSLAAYNPNLHFVIAGQGPERNNLEKLSENLGVEERVHFIGKVDPKEMPKVYADGDVFVFASDSETQGMCVLEAAAAGLPFVVINDGAFTDVVHNEVNGFTASANREEFTNNVSLLLKDVNLRRKFGEASKLLASNNFKGEKITSRLTSYYTEVLAQKKNKKRFLSKLVGRHSFVRFLKATEDVYKFFQLK